MAITYTPVIAELITRYNYQAIYTAIANTLNDLLVSDPGDNEVEAALNGFKTKFLGCVNVDAPNVDNTAALAGEMAGDDLALIDQILNDGNGYVDPIMGVAQCLADTGRGYAANHLDKTVYLYSRQWRLNS